MDVGALLTQARERAELSRRGLADAAGTGHSAIWAYETGRKSPTASTLDRLLAACGQQVRATLEPLMAHVDARVNAMLSGSPDLDLQGLVRLAASLDDDPDAPVAWPGHRPQRLGPVTWALDGATALAVHGLAVQAFGVGIVAVLDPALRSWLAGNGFSSSGFLSWWDGDLEEVREGLGDWTYSPLGLVCLRVVDVLPRALTVLVEGSDRPLPVVSVQEVERAHPQHAEVLKRWRERQASDVA